MKRAPIAVALLLAACGSKDPGRSSCAPCAVDTDCASQVEACLGGVCVTAVKDAQSCTPARSGASGSGGTTSTTTGSAAGTTSSSSSTTSRGASGSGSSSVSASSTSGSSGTATSTASTGSSGTATSTTGSSGTSTSTSSASSGSVGSSASSSASSSTSTGSTGSASSTGSTGTATSGSSGSTGAVPCIGPVGQDATQYIPTFADDFNGTALDPTIWSDHHWYAPVPPVTNYAVSGGTLKIWPDQGFVDRDINTDGTFYQTEGFFEIQAKLPVGAGVWPQFWLYNHDTSVRPRVEIMEAYPGGSGWGDANAHPIAYELTTWTDSSGTVAPAGDFRVDTSASDTSQTWHTYGLKWDATSTTFYFDGQQVYTCAATITDRMYILLSLDFGSASGQPSDTATPTGPSNPFEINYVRAWKAGTRTCP